MFCKSWRHDRKNIDASCEEAVEETSISQRRQTYVAREGSNARIGNYLATQQSKPCSNKNSMVFRHCFLSDDVEEKVRRMLVNEGSSAELLTALRWRQE